MISPKARHEATLGTRARAGALVALFASTAAAAQSAPQVPLITGLTIVSALHFPEGDRENIVTVAEVTSAGVRYTWDYKQHGEAKGSSLPDRARFRRFVPTSSQ